MSLSVCLVLNQSTSKKLGHPLDLSKLTPCCIVQVPSDTKVPRHDMCRSIISLSKK